MFCPADGTGAAANLFRRPCLNCRSLDDRFGTERLPTPGRIDKPRRARSYQSASAKARNYPGWCGTSAQ